MFPSSPVSIAVGWTSQSLPDAAHCWSGHRSCCSRRNPSPWIPCTARPAAASPGVPSLYFPWPGRQGNTGLGAWIEKSEKLKKQIIWGLHSPKSAQGKNRSISPGGWLDAFEYNHNKYLFLDGDSHIGFDLAEGLHQELGLIWGLDQFLWFIDSEVMLLTKLRICIMTELVSNCMNKMCNTTTYRQPQKSLKIHLTTFRP